MHVSIFFTRTGQHVVFDDDFFRRQNLSSDSLTSPKTSTDLNLVRGTITDPSATLNPFRVATTSTGTHAHVQDYSACLNLPYPGVYHQQAPYLVTRNGLDTPLLPGMPSSVVHALVNKDQLRCVNHLATLLVNNTGTSTWTGSGSVTVAKTEPEESTIGLPLSTVELCESKPKSEATTSSSSAEEYLNPWTAQLLAPLPPLRQFKFKNSRDDDDIDIESDDDDDDDDPDCLPPIETLNDDAYDRDGDHDDGDHDRATPSESGSVTGLGRASSESSESQESSESEEIEIEIDELLEDELNYDYNSNLNWTNPSTPETMNSDEKEPTRPGRPRNSDMRVFTQEEYDRAFRICECGYVALTPDQFRRHVRYKCERGPKEAPLCVDCGLTFSRPDALKRHRDSKTSCSAKRSGTGSALKA